jgi:hypothetical protein
MFPFTVKYSKILNINFDLIENETMLKCFEKNLKKDGVDRTHIEKDSILTFENDLFAIRPGLNWNIWEGIRKGNLEIVKTENKRVLIYTFDTSRFLIGGLFAGITFGLFSKMFLIGLIAFAFLGLFNWLIAIARHRYKLSELLNEVLEENELKNN